MYASQTFIKNKFQYLFYFNGKHAYIWIDTYTLVYMNFIVFKISFNICENNHKILFYSNIKYIFTRLIEWNFIAVCYSWKYNTYIVNSHCSFSQNANYKALVSLLEGRTNDTSLRSWTSTLFFLLPWDCLCFLCFIIF